MTNNSVQVVKDLNEIDIYRSYFHESNNNVLCKVSKVNDVLALKSTNNSYTQRTFNSLSDAHELIKNRKQKRLDRRSTNELINTMRKHELEIGLIIQYLNNAISLSDEELDSLANLIDKELDNIQLTEDVSSKFKIIVVDDGLKSHPLLVNSIDLINDVKAGDFIYVSIKENNYLKTNGYMIASEFGELEYELTAIEKAN